MTTSYCEVSVVAMTTNYYKVNAVAMTTSYDRVSGEVLPDTESSRSDLSCIKWSRAEETWH